MSLLSMLTQVYGRIGLTAPVSFSSSADPGAIQMVAIANEEGQDLCSRYPWQVLQTESTFTTVATESQGTIASLAGAGFRYIMNDIMWNRSLLRPVFGPLVPQDWQALKARNVTGPYTQFRIRGGNVLFIPVPVVGNNIYFEWLSRNWVTLNAGGTSATWANDADTGLLDEEIMAMGVLWRWKASKGMDYAEDYAQYERLVVDAMGRDGGKSRLNLEGGINSFPAGVLVPIGNWNV